MKNKKILIVAIVTFLVVIIALNFDKIVDEDKNKPLEDYYYVQNKCNIWKVYNLERGEKTFTTEELQEITIEPFNRLDPSQSVDLNKAGIGEGIRTIRIQCADEELCNNYICI